jgi:hypothetical protein
MGRQSCGLVNPHQCRLLPKFALILLRQKLCVSRASAARPGIQGQTRDSTVYRPWVPALRSLRSLGRDTTENICDAVVLKRDEFRFALSLNQTPFVPAEAGTQKPSPFASQSLGPRFRGDERKRRPKLTSSRASDCRDVSRTSESRALARRAERN